MNHLLIFFLSIITSSASALVGLGGGLMLIPFIVLIFGLPIKYVAGTMLFAMVPYTAVATVRNLRHGYVNFKIGIIMEIGSVVGVLIGANFSAVLPDLLLKVLFMLIVVYLILTLQIPENSSYNYIARGFKRINFIPPFIQCKTSKDARCSVPALILVGSIAGYFSGMLGIGGGFLKTPVLIVGVLLPPKIAVGTALFMIMITAFFGAAEHAFLGHIDYLIALVITAGMMIGAYVGTTIFKKLPEQRIKKYIFLAMFAVAVLTFFR